MSSTKEEIQKILQSMKLMDKELITTNLNTNVLNVREPTFIEKMILSITRQESMIAGNDLITLKSQLGEKVSPHPHVDCAFGFSNSSRAPNPSSFQYT